MEKARDADEIEAE